MSEADAVKSRKRWGCGHWAVVIVVVMLLAAFLLPTLCVSNQAASQSSSCNNARQIIMALKIYAQENNGMYPDAKHPEAVTANQVFRHLFIEDILLDERIFGAKASLFVPDGKIGTAPDFKEAVKRGENHWALVAGQATGTTGNFPLIFENALDASWPPKWNAGSAGQLRRGRVWRGNKIIVGHNDNTINVEKLVEFQDGLSLPELVVPGKASGIPELKVLDVE